MTTYMYTDKQLNELNQGPNVYSVNPEYAQRKENHDGLMKGKTDEEIDQQWKMLQSHRGKTSSKILVIYSNSERGEV